MLSIAVSRRTSGNITIVALLAGPVLAGFLPARASAPWKPATKIDCKACHYAEKPTDNDLTPCGQASLTFLKSHGYSRTDEQAKQRADGVRILKLWVAKPEPEKKPSSP